MSSNPILNGVYILVEDSFYTKAKEQFGVCTAYDQGEVQDEVPHGYGKECMRETFLWVEPGFAQKQRSTNRTFCKVYQCPQINSNCPKITIGRDGCQRCDGKTKKFFPLNHVCAFFVDTFCNLHDLNRLHYL